MFLSQNYIKRLDNSTIEIVTLKPQNISNPFLNKSTSGLCDVFTESNSYLSIEYSTVKIVKNSTFLM